MRARQRPWSLGGLCLAAIIALTACDAAGDPGASPRGGAEAAHCDLLTGARRTVDYHLSLLLSLDDPAALEELRASDAPFRIDPGAFRAAVEALSALSGAESEASRLRRIAELLEQHAGVEDPFAPDSVSGQRLAELANGAFGEVRVGLDSALRALGCRVR